jgi:hypothetical protein
MRVRPNGLLPPQPLVRFGTKLQKRRMRLVVKVVAMEMMTCLKGMTATLSNRQ